jgi:hypothetical protein
MHLLVMMGRMPDNDFGKAYYSTRAFLDGGEMYGYNESIPAMFEEGKPVNLWNLNPPHFHVIVLPIARLIPHVALLVWIVVNFVCFYVGLRWVADELGLQAQHRPAALLWVLSFTGTNAACICGHCSFMLFLPVTAMWLAARRGRWGSAGAWLGLALSIKPFLLIIVPYLILKRRWDALASMLAVIIACFAVGFAVFGVHNHLEWLGRFRETGNWAWQFINGSIYGMLSRSLLVNPMSTPVVEGSQQLVTALWLAIGTPMGLVTLAVAASDSSPRGVDRAMAVLLVAAMMLSPLGWTYYYCLPLGPVAVMALGWWREAGQNARWRKGFMTAGLVMFAWPLWVAGLFQPYVASTLLIGNLYSYGTVAVWVALVLDGIRACRTPAARTVEVATLPPSTVSCPIFQAAKA